jgi:hypothetical protein
MLPGSAGFKKLPLTATYQLLPQVLPIAENNYRAEFAPAGCE